MNKIELFSAISQKVKRRICTIIANKRSTTVPYPNHETKKPIPGSA